MPYINKLEKKKTSSERKETDMRELRRKAYNNTAWRKLRDLYMHEHPICEECLKKGKITAAEDVHHKRSPFRKGEINYGLLMDYDNLMAVCKECHGEIHAAQQGHISPEEILKQLDALFDENIKDEDLE
jgi:5-methylcytosine-specific restriction protein A